MSGMRRAISAAVLVALVAMATLAQDESASLKFLVIRDYNGKPVRNASVVMHPVEKNGKQSRGGEQINRLIQKDDKAYSETAGTN
jgi:hypothetical protein